VNAVFDVRPPEWTTHWPRAAPHPTRPWTVSNGTDYALLDPDRGRLTTPEPSVDSRLPALARALEGGELVAYRHHRRAVVRHRERFVKVVRPGRVADLVNRHECATSESTYASPVVLDHTDDGCVDLSTLLGRSLHERIRRNSSPPISSVARLLANVAATDASTLPDASVDSSQRWIETVCRIDPDLRSCLEEVAATLPLLDITGSAFVHGDLHDKNIIIDLVGDFGVIDLDGACRGAPEIDVANLSVHLELRALQSGQSADVGAAQSAQLVAACADSADLDLDLVHDVQRHTWFRLACLYRCRLAGRHLTSALLDRSISPPFASDQISHMSSRVGSPESRRAQTASATRGAVTGKPT
jgi:Phosphotransferase enzyme family